MFKYCLNNNKKKNERGKIVEEGTSRSPDRINNNTFTYSIYRHFIRGILLYEDVLHIKWIVYHKEELMRALN